MRVLIDTNIVIYREDDKPVSDSLQRVLALLQRLKADLLVHPQSLQDLQGDKNSRRRGIMLSKLGAYSLLDRPPDPTSDATYLATVGNSSTARDLIDNAILYSVYKDAVDFLITEDREIYRKARRLGISDRVLLIDDALSTFQAFIPEPTLSPPALKEEYVYNLSLTDPFFDSLRGAYPGFEDWFRKISREGRKCFVHFDEGHRVAALLIYKIENESIRSDPALEQKERLKLCTFKVAREGQKIGELFIKLSVDVALKNSIAEIYLTCFTQSEQRLVDLIAEYGFVKSAPLPNGEDVYLKRLHPQRSECQRLSPEEIAATYYPCFYDGPAVRKYIVPIRPQYHSRLFTDFPGRQVSLAEHSGWFVIEGNTIKKAYICHSRIRTMRAGDVLMFYLSGRKLLTSVGTVESAYIESQDSQSIVDRVGIRTVYSLEEIQEMARRQTTVILFRHHFHLTKPLPLQTLKALGILSAAPQSITRITDESYARARLGSCLDERFTVH